jgi:hypothetical protein
MFGLSAAVPSVGNRTRDDPGQKVNPIGLARTSGAGARVERANRKSQSRMPCRTKNCGTPLQPALLPGGFALGTTSHAAHHD